MKSILNFSLCLLIFLAFQACGTVPQQTASHIGDGGDRFGSGTFEQPFDQGGELPSSNGFTQPEPNPAEKKSFDHQNELNIGIILIPVSIREGFTLSDDSIRLCQILFKQACGHVTSQVRPPYYYPRAPVSLSEESEKSRDN